jgi:Ala-tRNA(Pro) deacylase
MSEHTAAAEMPPGTKGRAELFALFDELGIASETVEHAPAFTVEDAQGLRGQMPGGHAKNLLLKDKKGSLWLVVAREEAAIDLKRLGKALGAKSWSFAKPEVMAERLGVTPGSVSPFGLINDRERALTVVLDTKLMAQEPLNFHPLVNTATTTLSGRDFRRFLDATGHEPVLLDVENPDDDDI